MLDIIAVIFENVLVMILTIIVLAGGFYVLLLVLNAWLKLKAGSREKDGLSSLWASAMKETRPAADEDRSADGRS